MKTDALKKQIDVASGRIPADLVITNGIIADVYTGAFVEADIAVCGGVVAAVGGRGVYRGLETVDAGGQYVLPGFIDGHIHIESSFLSPPQLCRLLAPLGTSTLIADPHEIMNVSGLAGLDFMLESSEGLPLDIKFMAPSCVPSTPFEHSGAVLDARSLEAPLANDRVLGLGEMMDCPGVINCSGAVLDKILAALNKGKIIDGHSPGIAGLDLAAYAAGRIHTDHECSTVEDMRLRIAMGMYVLLRQGSACHDLQNLIPGVTAGNSRRCLICSDDLQPRTILEKGHLDNDLRICVAAGLDPMTAVRMVTLNAAECYGLKDRGGFAPGLRADMVLVKDLRDFRAGKVFLEGRLVAENGSYLPGPPPPCDDSPVRSSFNVRGFSVKKLQMPLKSGTAWVVDIKRGGVVTGKGKAAVRRDSDGNFIFDPFLDVVKIAVVERHHGTGNVGLGLLRGYGIKGGAVAISVAHDSHNIIAAGTCDGDIAAAVERIVAMRGGAVLVRDGAILGEMALPLGGLMSDQNGEWVCGKLTALQEAAFAELGVNREVEPLMTLCFMSLPVIPELKVTDKGLFDFASFGIIPIEAE